MGIVSDLHMISNDQFRTCLDLRNKEITVEAKKYYFSEAIKSTINTDINLNSHISFKAGVVTLHTTVLLQASLIIDY